MAVATATSRKGGLVSKGPWSTNIPGSGWLAIDPFQVVLYKCQVRLVFPNKNMWHHVYWCILYHWSHTLFMWIIHLYIWCSLGLAQIIYNNLSITISRLAIKTKKTITAASRNVYLSPNHLLFQTKFQMVWEICLERPSASVRSHQFCTNFCQDPRDLRIWGYCWWLRAAPIWPGSLYYPTQTMHQKNGKIIKTTLEKCIVWSPKIQLQHKSSIYSSKSWPYSFRAFLWEKNMT